MIAKTMLILFSYDDTIIAIVVLKILNLFLHKRISLYKWLIIILLFDNIK